MCCRVWRWRRYVCACGRGDAAQGRPKASGHARTSHAPSLFRAPHTTVRRGLRGTTYKCTAKGWAWDTHLHCRLHPRCQTAHLEQQAQLREPEWEAQIY